MEKNQKGGIPGATDEFRRKLLNCSSQFLNTDFQWFLMA